MYIFIVSLSFCLCFLADEDEITWESEQLIKKEKKKQINVSERT